MSKVILIVPRVERGRGGGHLVRCAALVSSLRGAGREAFLFINNSGTNPASENARETSGTGAEINSLVSSTLALVKDFDPAWLLGRAPPEPGLVIIDGFRSSGGEFEEWSKLAPVLGIDEGGKHRSRFDFLIDLLPGIYRPESANLEAPGFLPLPRNRRPRFAAGRKPLRILLSFGAEDGAGLGPLAAEALSPLSPGEAEITLLGSGGQIKTKGVNQVERIPELREHLAEYDLLITHYGLGAFEALRARLPVILVSPTPYHEMLARAAGFVSAGTGKRASRRLGRLLLKRREKKEKPALNNDFLEKLFSRCEALAELYGPEKTFENIKKYQPQFGENLTLGAYLASASPSVSRVCRACGGKTAPAKNRTVIARFPERTYRLCPDCGLIGMDRLTPPPIEYGKDYFFDFYKKQYGKTYLEDFPALVEAGGKRLSHIKALLENSPGKKRGQNENPRPRVLDIGCAYGPFLAAAKAEGFECEGIEPAEDAARYVREELGIPCRYGFFPDAPGGNAAVTESVYDAVTLWYVIEHFENPGTVLGEINRVLKPGGVLAFSTPSFSGISGRKSLKTFLEKSPADHWTVWRPGVCKKTLKKHGFALKKIVVTGHHPERFPIIGNHLKKGGFVFALLMRASRLFRLGDSFEAYAVKEKSR